MKNFYTIFCILFVCCNLSAGTPVMDGVFDGTGVWGAAKAVDNTPGTLGWNNTNAKALYITSDATYIYFGAELAADVWQKVGFVINTQAGGGATVTPNDPWEHGINYTHSDKPDYVVEIEFQGYSGAGYSELRTSNGTNFSTSTSLCCTEIGVNRTQFVEIRIPKTTLGSPASVQAQFFISGNTSCEHGVFDAVPNETNQSDWNGGLGCASSPLTSLGTYSSLVVLPIELTHFAAKSNNTTINLAWQTASEKSNSHFDIERSANGLNWSKMGTVKGFGTTQQQTDYRFVDEQPLSNVNYYRLKQVDFDGQFNYSSVVTAVVGKGKLNGIFPNPATSKITLLGNDLTNNDNITIFDTNGRIVKIQKIKDAQIDVSDLTAGLYILSISNNNGQSLERIRFVKQ
jgi:hypothetical protein